MTIQESQITFNGMNVIIPDAKNYPIAHRKASSYSCPLGPATGRGWILLTREQLNSIDPGNGSYPLEFETRTDGDSREQIIVKELYVSSAVRTGPGGDKDALDAAYLVELVDIRFHLNRWTVTQRQFNVRSWAGGMDYDILHDGKYILETVNGLGGGGRPWLWEDILEMLWNDCKLLGTFPGIPTKNPPAVPENLHFLGVNAWYALHCTLEKIGLTTAYNPLDATFSIVELPNPGSDQDIPDLGPIMYDAAPFSGGACVSPKTVRVMFPIKYEDYGQERDTEAQDNWMTTASGYYIDVKNRDFALEGTILPLWDDLPALMGHASNTISNLYELQNKAAWRAQTWFDKNTRNDFSRDHVIGQGLTKMLVGPRVKEVIWRDYGLKEDGLVTEAANYPGLKWEAVDENGNFKGAGGGGGSTHGDSSAYPGDKNIETIGPKENDSTLDFGRRTTPTYPRLPNFVTYTIGDPANKCCPEDGDMLKALKKPYIFGGFVIRYSGVTGRMEILEPCWIYALAERKCDAPGPIIRYGDVSYGRLTGMFTMNGGNYGGLRLPLYVTRPEDYLSAEVACVCGDSAFQAREIKRKCKIDNITFDYDIFKMYAPDNNIDGVCISIESPCKYSILNQWDLNQRPVWTRDPKVSGNMKVGGVLRFTGERDGWGSGSIRTIGGEDLNLDGGATCGAPIEVTKIKGTCVTWGYGQVGITGTINFYLCCDADYVCTPLSFINGKLVGVEDGTTFDQSCGSFTSSPQCPKSQCPPGDCPPCQRCNPLGCIEAGGSQNDGSITPPNPGPIPGGDDDPIHDIGGDALPGAPPLTPSDPADPVHNIGGDTQSTAQSGKCTEGMTFVCGADSTPANCDWATGIFRSDFVDYRPLTHESFVALLAEASSRLGPEDYYAFRNAVLGCQNFEAGFKNQIRGDGSGVPDACSGLKFKNETPSTAAAFNKANIEVQSKFSSYRPFTDATYAAMLSLFSDGGAYQLEAVEFIKLRTIAACWYNEERKDDAAAANAAGSSDSSGSDGEFNFDPGDD